MTGRATAGPRRPLLAHRHGHGRAVVAARATRTAGSSPTDAWTAGYRHGEELLPRVDGAPRAQPASGSPTSAAIIVGTGPRGVHRAAGRPGHRQGARARARRPARRHLPRRPSSLAGRRRPDGLALLLPAGPSDRVLGPSRRGGPRRPAGGPGRGLDLAPGTAVAVDLDGRAPARRGAARRGRSGGGPAGSCGARPPSPTARRR